MRFDQGVHEPSDHVFRQVKRDPFRLIGRSVIKADRHLPIGQLQHRYVAERLNQNLPALLFHPVSPAVPEAAASLAFPTVPRTGQKGDAHSRERRGQLGMGRTDGPRFPRRAEAVPR